MIKWAGVVVLLGVSCGLCAQAPAVGGAGGAAAVQTAGRAPAVLPGNGLAQHDFVYSGESHDRRIFIVRGGKIVWSYDDPAGKGEISDMVMLSNGNILFAHQFGVTEIAPDKKVVWNYDVPAGHEIHTAVPIGKDRVLYIMNGDPGAVLRVVNIDDGRDREGAAAGGEAAGERAWAVSPRAADPGGDADGGAHGPGQGGGVRLERA